MDDWAIEVLREEFAEDFAQYELTESLGQPTCSVNHPFHFEWFGPPPTGDACPGCGAQV